MKKVLVSELTGTALDWAVAKCGDFTLYQIWPDRISIISGRNWENYSPSTDWSQGGPIIEQNEITVLRGNDLFFPNGNEQGDYYEQLWIAQVYGEAMRFMHGQTPLQAAMRCYVASKLGDEIEIPEELS